MVKEIRLLGRRVRIVDLKIWAVGALILILNLVFFFLFWYK